MNGLKRLSIIGATLLLLASMVPGVAAQETAPYIRVNNQPIVEGLIEVDQIIIDGPGWIVVHADDDGAPGEVIGYRELAAGENRFVQIEVDADKATDVLHLMLHTDAGREGTFEPEGDDAPMMMDDEPYIVSFEVQEEIVGLEEDEEMDEQPEISVRNQTITDEDMIIVERVVTVEPAWIVVRADEDGMPGTIVGYAALNEGENEDVEVEIDRTGATEMLYVTLYRDLGTVGTFESPGADVPLEVDDEPVEMTFTVTGLEAEMAEETAEEPRVLPASGGIATPWAGIALIAIGLITLTAGVVLSRARNKG